MFFSQIGLDEKQSQQGFFGAAESEELSKSDVSKQLEGKEELLVEQSVDLQQTTGLEIVEALYDKIPQSQEESKRIGKKFSQKIFRKVPIMGESI